MTLLGASFTFESIAGGGPTVGEVQISANSLTNGTTFSFITYNPSSTSAANAAADSVLYITLQLANSTAY